MTAQPKHNVEIIAIASGKGGTGKTLIASCLGYTLIRVTHSVLMIDADTATNGMSLFLLGPQGTKTISDIGPESTFSEFLLAHSNGAGFEAIPYPLNRSASDDHGSGSREIIYNTIISSTEAYGDLPPEGIRPAVPPLERDEFRAAVSTLFQKLEDDAVLDYVLVDTRGGFGFESTDVCALAHSFIVVTEPDYTSIYQDRNLVQRISAAAEELNTRPLLRAIIVNKATEISQDSERLVLANVETDFRMALTREFPVRFDDTHAVPLDIEAIKAYKTHKIPFVDAPQSQFSFSLLQAFAGILRIVPNRWEPNRVSEWNKLSDSVGESITEHYRVAREEEELREKRADELEALHVESEENRTTVARLEREAAELTARYERELKRVDEFMSAVSKQEPR